MGEAPEGHTIERIDPFGDYTPANCRWAPKAEQAKNTRRARVVDHDGRPLALAEYAALAGVSVTTAWRRSRYLHPAAVQAALQR